MWNDTEEQFTYERAIERLELEFHVWVDEWHIEEDALHAGWAAGMLRRWYPGVRAEVLAEVINRYGWH